MLKQYISEKMKGKTEMINVGIIGCGKIAQIRHVPEYLANKDAEIAAWYDVNSERAKELAERFGGKAYESVEALLAVPRIDAVSICAANMAHASLAIQALREGKHVLCEKPMATTPGDCESMVREARAAEKKLMIDQNQRLLRTHQKARELLLRGLIGKVITFRTTFGHGGPETWSIDPGKNTWFFDRKKSAMGALADLGVHKTDLIQYLLDTRITETTARIDTLHKRDATGNLIGVDDNAICIYRMENGTLGTMTASWTYYGEEDNSTVLYGEKGIMHIFDDPKFSIRVILKNGEEINYQLDKIQTNDNQTSTGIIDAFIDCIKNDTEPMISGENVLEAMKAVFGSIESAKSGTTVQIR